MLDHIAQNLAQRLTLDTLAAMTSMSVDHFVRAFEQATGSTPHRWILERRLDAACREIASMVGYDYVIVNEYLPAAVEQFLTIVRAERCKVVRLRRDDLKRQLASFGADR